MSTNEGEKEYRGRTNGSVVVITASGSRPLNPRNDVRNHSPDGFAWGYGGSGPAQLALALLCDVAGVEVAREHYQDFKWEVIGKLQQNSGWILPISSIRAWLEQRKPAAAIDDDLDAGKWASEGGR